VAATKTSRNSLDTIGSAASPFVKLIHGWFASVSATVGDLAPFVETTIEFDGRIERVDFLIDSGSDTSILMPVDAERLMGERLFALDFERGDQAVRLDGIGGYAFRVLPIEASMTLEDDAQTPIHIGTQLWLADPEPEGNWAEPSLFGRDAIRPGDFELSYINNTVTLIRPDDA
jgi:hypothetical protein